MRRRSRTRTGLLAPLVLTAVAGGCGGQTNYANDPRPPVVANVDAAIVQSHIQVSPKKVGGGPMRLNVANLTSKSHDVTLEPVAGGASAKSGPINPQGTATIQLNVKQGTYRIRATAGISPAVLTVGPQRKSAQNQLLQP